LSFSEAIEKICPHFDKIDAIVADKPNVQPLYASSSRGRPRKTPAATHPDISQLSLTGNDKQSGAEDDDNYEDLEDEQEEDFDTPSLRKANKKGKNPKNPAGSTGNPFSISSLKQTQQIRGKKPLSFGDSLFYSNQFKFTLEEKRFEYQEHERAKEREEERRRWDEKFAWEQQEASRRHEEAMENFKLQQLKMELELELLGGKK